MEYRKVSIKYVSSRIHIDHTFDLITKYRFFIIPNDKINTKTTPNQLIKSTLSVKLCIHNLPQVQPQPSKSPRKTPPQTQVTKFHRRIEHGPPRSGSLGSLLRDLRRLGERRSSISCSGTLRQGPPKLSYRRDPSGRIVICTLYVGVRL